LSLSTTKEESERKRERGRKGRKEKIIKLIVNLNLSLLIIKIIN
jgi:hypothetical protein